MTDEQLSMYLVSAHVWISASAAVILDMYVVRAKIRKAIKDIVIAINMLVDLLRIHNVAELTDIINMSLMAHQHPTINNQFIHL